MRSEVLFVVLLGFLLFISVIQTVELIQINEKISGDMITGSVIEAKDSVSNAEAPSNLQNLPDMVGGC